MEGAAPVVVGLFEEERGEVSLLATRCRSCEAIYFPRCTSCRNPDCDAKAVEDWALPRQGTLYSYTIQRYQPPSLFRMDDWHPYAIGLIDLGEGVRVMGMLDSIELDEIAIGMPMRLASRALYRDSEGREVRTYAFVPDGGDGT